LQSLTSLLLTGQIPFSTTRSEVVAFLGRNSRILNDHEEPVHIVMERVTGKTQDVYVEFCTLTDAMRAVERHSSSKAGVTESGAPRHPRLGNRPVVVELSSQGALMKSLFPQARGIFWNNAVPEVQPFRPAEPWENFKGFVSAEEMVMLVKHVEVPHRSPFSKDCPQRAYECMISTVKKLPWYKTDCITIHQRWAVFDAVVKLITLLDKAIVTKQHSAYLTPVLLKRLITAAMLCPGFTVVQKDTIAFMTGMSDEQQLEFNQPRYGSAWVQQYTLCPKVGYPLDTLEVGLPPTFSSTPQDSEWRLTC